jgi:hypothetical protein
MPPNGNSKNLAPLVFRVPDFIFWLKGALSMSYMLFFATPSSRPPTHWVFNWVFRGAQNKIGSTKNEQDEVL